MSKLKNKFYELLKPLWEAQNFMFKKSVGSFVKKKGDKKYNISFHWDGRGGTTMINSIEYKISEKDKEDRLKIFEYFEIEFVKPIPDWYGKPTEMGKSYDMSFMKHNILIPVMYTQQCWI